MSQILLTPRINRKKEVRYMAGKPDYNYCIQYRKESGDKSQIIKFCGTDSVNTHRTIRAIIREEMNNVNVEDIWMETLTGWEKHGEKLRWYDMEYFSKL